MFYNNTDDSFLYKGLRKQLVAGLRTKGIHDENVLDAIGKIPRHLFVEKFLAQSSYQDKALPIGAGQTISQPYTVAFQSQLLEVKKGDKILEIGTGSGYQCAVLLEMGAKVFTIERQKELFIKTQVIFRELNYRPQCFHDDGYLGKPTYGPFHKILITAAAPFVPKELLQQLHIGGILVAPVGNPESQIMTTVRRISDTEFQYKEHGYFVFVPMLTGIVK